MEFLTLEEERRLTIALYDQISYDRRQAACMIDAMMDQLRNCHLTVDYKMTLSRKVITARRKWFEDAFLDLEILSISDLLNHAAGILSWSHQLSELFETNARMIRHRMCRIRELNFHRQRLQWCL